jgi:hypothetical protein
MIAGVKRRDTARPDEAAARVRDLAAFYGIHSLRLAGILGFELGEPKLHPDRRG